MAARPVPQPPLSADLLADLHADNVAPELSEQLWSRVHDDPDALQYLRALDDVTSELRNLGQDPEILHGMPTDVQSRLDRLLDDLAAEDGPVDDAHGAAVHSLPPGRSPAPADGDAAISTTRPMAAIPRDDDPSRPAHLDTRRAHRLRWLTAAAAVVAVVVGTLIGVDAVRGHDTTSHAVPTAEPESVRLGDDLPAATLLSAIGRNDVTGPLAGPEALNSCIAAAGLHRPVLGSMNVTFRGRPAVVIILTGPQPPQITALVVGTGCRPGNAQTLDMRDIG